MTSPITELRAGEALPQQPVAKLLVTTSGDINAACQPIIDGTVRPQRIAFVTSNSKRRRRRLALNLGLSQCFGCPVRVFCDEDEARGWLQRA